MKVVFQSKQAYLQIAHENIFHVGEVITPYSFDGRWLGSQEEYEALQKIPDPEMVNKLYCFREGEKHNQLTLEREDAIEGMRAYIAQRGDYIIVELDNEGRVKYDEPEGAIFECETPLTNLYPSVYRGYSSVGKIFVFNMGENQNRYITSNLEEIKILREFIKGRTDEKFREVNE